MDLQGYVVLIPGADRPYYRHDLPKSWEPPTKVFKFTLHLPGFKKEDECIMAYGVELVEPSTTHG